MMTVKELIKVLEKVENKNLKVVIRGEDPSDYVYFKNIEGVKVGNVYYEGLEEYKVRKRVIIDGGVF
jgi:hypothetical protein